MSNFVTEVLQYNFKKAFYSDMNNKYRLVGPISFYLTASLSLFNYNSLFKPLSLVFSTACFSWKILYRHQLILGACIVQVPIYMHLSAITCLHNKAAVITNTFCLDRCILDTLFTQNLQAISIAITCLYNKPAIVKKCFLFRCTVDRSILDTLLIKTYMYKQYLNTYYTLREVNTIAS